LEQVRIAVVGVGSLGESHVRVIKELSSVYLSGIYDISQRRADEIAQKYDTKTYANLTEIVEDATAVTVVVPTTAHYAVASYMLSNNLHTFVEKPITQTVEEAEHLIQLSESRNRVLQVGHIERFNNAFTAIEGISVSPGFIESHRLASFDPRGTDVSVIHDLMIHDIDLIRCLVQADLEKIDATGVAVISDQVDIANARLLFVNGCVANITASRISLKKMRKMRIFQKDHYISMNFLTGESEIYQLITEPNSAINKRSGIPIKTVSGPNKQIVIQKNTNKSIEPLKLELDSFARAVRGEADPPINGYDGREALRISLQIIDQINSRHP